MVLVATAGCASEGPLRPPSLHLPAKVKGLSAERFGNTVELQWTTPSRTTDDVLLVARHGSAAPLSAEICRGEPVAPGPCTPVARVPVQSGLPASYRDTLTGPWITGPIRPMQYRIRILNNKDRGADGVSVNAVAGEAPPSPLGLRAIPAAGGGVELRWQPAPGNGDAISIRATRGTITKSSLLAVSTDAGGAVDTGAKFGEAQHYTVFRTRTIALDHQQLTLHSEAAQTTVLASALPPPPAAPIGLEAVVSTLGVPEIDLVWQAAEGTGVTGYLVTRQDGDAAPITLTPKPIPNFSYADTAVTPGVHYRYRVAAVDAHGATGPASAPVDRTIALP